MFYRQSEERSSLAADPTAQKRQLLPSEMPTIIAADLTVNGNLTSTGVVHIEGHVRGIVTCTVLEIGATVSIQGGIIAENATVRGRIEGIIRAHKIVLAATCHVEGNLLYETLAIE